MIRINLFYPQCVTLPKKNNGSFAMLQTYTLILLIMISSATKLAAAAKAPSRAGRPDKASA